MRATLVIVVLTLGGCSYGAFSDLEEKAPAVRITQEGSISSGSFGDHLVGLSFPDKNQSGGVLAVVGNGEPAFVTVSFTASGKPANDPADGTKIKSEFNDPNRFNDLAPAPSTSPIGSFGGPFAYVASSSKSGGEVRVIDLERTRTAAEVYDAPEEPAKVMDFGMSVAPAALDDDQNEDDLAVGASDAVVLMRAESGVPGWPAMQNDPAVVSGGEFPRGKFAVIAAGNLDTSTNEYEVVAAIPERNIVVIIHHVSDCFADTSVLCDRYFKLEAPSGSTNFGWSLLIDSTRQRLFVGDPESNAVHYYDFQSSHFSDPPTAPPEPQSLETPEAEGFGKSLVIGQVTGAGHMLVVGAPGTTVGGAQGAGMLFIYDENMSPVGNGVALASPETNTLLGQTLAILPFRSNNVAHEVLVASGRHDVFVFFANLTGESHRDVRER